MNKIIHTYTKGKLKVEYILEQKDGEYLHSLLVGWNGKLTGMTTLFNKKKTPNAYQFYESLDLVDTRFFKSINWIDEWGEVIRELDKIIKQK